MDSQCNAHSDLAATDTETHVIRLSTVGFLLGIVLFLIPVPPFAMIAAILVLGVSVVLPLLGEFAHVDAPELDLVEQLRSLFFGPGSELNGFVVV